MGDWCFDVRIVGWYSSVCGAEQSEQRRHVREDFEGFVFKDSEFCQRQGEGFYREVFGSRSGEKSDGGRVVRARVVSFEDDGETGGSSAPISPTSTDAKTTVKSTKAEEEEGETTATTPSRKTIPNEGEKGTTSVGDTTSDGNGAVIKILKEQIKIANEINNNAVGSTSHEIEEIVEEEEAENDTKNKKKQSVGSEDDPWSTSDESLENEENYVRELASIAAGRSASIAIAGISGSTHNAGGGGVYSTHVPTSQLSLMKEKAAAAAPISPLKHPMKAPLPPPSLSTKKSSTTPWKAWDSALRKSI